MGTPNLMSKLNQASIQNSASNLAFSAGEKLRGGRGGRGEGGKSPIVLQEHGTENCKKRACQLDLSKKSSVGKENVS